MKKSIWIILKLIIFIIIVIGALIFSESPFKSIFQNKYAFHISREFFAAAVALVSFIIFTVYIDKIKLKQSVLFAATRKLKNLSFGLLIGIIMIIITVFLLWIGNWVEFSQISDKDPVIITVGTSLIAMVFAAFWEELVFRGYVLNNLEKLMGKHFACIFVAIAFGSLHLFSPIKSPGIVISTFFSGLLLNYAFLNTRNLFFPIGIHFAWNFLNNLVFTEKIIHVDYQNTFFAGNKNPEEGLIAISVTALAFLYVFVKTAKTKDS